MYVAVDIGATKTLIARFSSRGGVTRRRKFKTAYSREKFLNDLTRNLKDFLGPKVKAVVVAVPGHIKQDFEQKNCSVKFGNRDWGWFDLSTPIKKLFSGEIYFENDANLASIFESYGLSGRTLFLTFSTGIGGGLAENGRLISDELEPGHKKCVYQGLRAEWEDIAACSALEKVYHVDQATNLRGKEVMEDIAARVALGLTDLISEHHPDTIVIGGPLGRIFKKFSKYLPNLGVKYKRPKRPLESVIYGCYIFGKSKK